MTLITELVVMEIACMEPDQNYYYPAATRAVLFTINFSLILSFCCSNIIYCQFLPRLMQLQLEHYFLSIFFLALSSSSVGITFTISFCLIPCCSWNIIYYKFLPRFIQLQLEHYLLSVFSLTLSSALVGITFTINFCFVSSYSCDIYYIIFCCSLNFICCQYFPLYPAAVGTLFTINIFPHFILLQLGHLLSAFALYPAAVGTLFTINFCLNLSCCTWNIILFSTLFLFNLLVDHTLRYSVQTLH